MNRLTSVFAALLLATGFVSANEENNDHHHYYFGSVEIIPKYGVDVSSIVKAAYHHDETHLWSVQSAVAHHLLDKCDFPRRIVHALGRGGALRLPNTEDQQVDFQVGAGAFAGRSKTNIAVQLKVLKGTSQEISHEKRVMGRDDMLTISRGLGFVLTQGSAMMLDTHRTSEIPTKEEDHIHFAHTNYTVLQMPFDDTTSRNSERSMTIYDLMKDINPNVYQSTGYAQYNELFIGILPPGQHVIPPNPHFNADGDITTDPTFQVITDAEFQQAYWDATIAYNEAEQFIDNDAAHKVVYTPTSAEMGIADGETEEPWLFTGTLAVPKNPWSKVPNGNYFLKHIESGAHNDLRQLRKEVLQVIDEINNKIKGNETAQLVDVIIPIIESATCGQNVEPDREFDFDPSESSPKDKKAGKIIGSLIAVFFVLGVCYCMRRRRRFHKASETAQHVNPGDQNLYDEKPFKDEDPAHNTEMV